VATQTTGPAPTAGVVATAPAPLGGAEATAPTTIPGVVPAVAIQEMIDTTVQEHVLDPAPHPAYDTIPSLRLLFENGLV
jgi:hypothetical protein